MTLQATGDYFVSASVDATWAFCDTATGAVITQARLPRLASRATCHIA